MTYSELKNFIFLKNNYYKNSPDISMEELLYIYNCANEEDLYEYISKDEIEIFSDYLKRSYTENINDHEYVSQKAKEDFQKMSSEEIKSNISEFIKKSLISDDIFSNIPDKSILLDMYDVIPQRYINSVLQNIDTDEIINYINSNGKNTNMLLNKIAIDTNDNFVETSLNRITSDINRAKLLIYKQDNSLSNYVENEFARHQIFLSSYSSSKPGIPSSEDLIKDLYVREEILDEISQIEDEKEKAIFISNIEGINVDMKESFLDQIKEPENRDIVIQSLKSYVDPNLESLNNLAQTMILEFYENELGENFTDEKRERLNRVFNRTSVFFDDLEKNVNGSADHVLRTLSISNKHRNSLNSNLGFFVHEYSHLLSNFDFSIVDELPDKTFEEGMADVFADTVINSYLQRHNQIELDRKKVRIDNPYMAYSGYDMENAWVRTALFGLESSHKDKDAIIEYTLGNKYKFAEMIFGREKNGVDPSETQDYHLPNLSTSRKELYYSPQLDYSNIDRNSLYFKRNSILPLFELQNRLQGTDVDLVGILSEGKSYYADYVAKKYFSGKKFYEIPKEEFKDFIDLMYLQIDKSGSQKPIIDILKYSNGEIDKLTEEEVKDNPIEILENTAILYGNAKNLKAGYKLETVIGCCLEAAPLKLKGMYSEEDFLDKKDEIINTYRNLFSEKSESNRFINEYIDNFEYQCEMLLERETEGQTLSSEVDPNERMDKTLDPKAALKNALKNGKITQEDLTHARLIEDGEKNIQKSDSESIIDK